MRAQRLNQQSLSERILGGPWINPNFPAPDRLAVRLAIASTFFALLYAIPHLWWGLGIQALFPGTLDDADNNLLVNIIAFWGMGLVSLTSGVLALALVRPWGEGLPRWLLVIHAWLGAAILILRGGIGIVESATLATGVRECPFMGCDVSEWNERGFTTTSWFWEPLFLVWGIALRTTIWLLPRRR